MQEIVLELSFVIALSLIIGLGSSMVGISGGAFKTPMLIIIFGLTTHFSTAVSLFSALFLAIPSSIQYYRQDRKSISTRIGFTIAAFSVPGVIVGVLVKSVIVDDYVLRIIFGASLFPIAMMMMLTRRKESDTKSCSVIEEYDHSKCSSLQWTIFAIGSIVAGFAAGLLGLGGGTIVVPAMCIILGMPMVMAAATSVFAMIFTASAGTIVNYAIVAQTGNLYSFLFYSLAIGAGMIVGSQIGPKYACKFDGVLLRRIFGVILVFPLVQMMNIGKFLLNPYGVDYLMETLGDILVWIIVIISHSFVWLYWFISTSHFHSSINRAEDSRLTP